MRRMMLFAGMLLAVFLANARNTVYNVKDYGAAGDGKKLDAKAINKAIEASSDAGGGRVYVPAGDYLSGSIRLKSNISLYLEQGATIIATDQDPGSAYDQEEQTINA